MLIGKRFTIVNATLALDVIDGKIRAVTIPAGAIIKVVSGPSDGVQQMIDVLWESRTLTMFLIDVTRRGTEVVDQDADA